MPKKNDIRQYSDSELSLEVMNTEPLYREVMRRDATYFSIVRFVGDRFIFTQAQLVDFIETVYQSRAELFEVQDERATN